MLLHAVRRWISLFAVALVLTVTPVSVQPALATVTEQAPRRPTTSFEAWFEVEQPPTLPFEPVQLVVDFPVGAKVARHLHGGPGYITIGAPTGQLPPGAVSRFESRLRFDTAPGRYKVGQMLQTYAPGAWTMSEVAAAPRVLTVISGEVTVLNGASEKVYKAGEAWVEMAGQAWLSGNPGSTPAVAAASTIVPQR